MRFLVHHLLEAAAAASGDATAVVDGGRSISYAELDASANRVARLLSEIGVRRGDRVALYMDKSLEAVVGVYGVLKAGAAYVPLDPQAPVARLAYIVANCGVECVVTALEKRDNWTALLQRGAPLRSVVVLNDLGSTAVDAPGLDTYSLEDIRSRSADPLDVAVIDQDLAYILYTSGSTGGPKGVMLTHRNALAFVDWAAEEFAVTDADRLSSHAPFHFDLSVFDLFAAAYGGAAVVLVPPKTSIFPVEVARFIRENRITVWYSVPSILSMLVMRGGLRTGDLPSLRTILFAGEVFPTKYLRQLMNLLPAVRFANLYGPTETNVCTWYEVPPLPDDMTEPIPIGKPIPNDEVFIVGDDGRRAAHGEEGELYVRGATVMRGYWADAERTARSLVANPLDAELSDPVYRTGDLVRRGDDGNLVFLGRRDSQIKSRGYRIELGEVESALYAHPSVVECAVVAVPDELVTNRIKAYVVVKDETRERGLSAFCATRIPRYMVPETFELMRRLPKTSTGKVDRRALAGRVG